MEGFLQSLNALITPAAWSIVQTGLQVAFLLLVLRILRLIYCFRGFAALRHPGRSKRTFNAVFICLSLLFGAILLYQASWQLTGLFRPDFVAFMQRHDRRQFNPAHYIQRGRILDQRGRVLAFSDEFGDEVFRRYPLGPAFAHAVGYSHPSFGATGMEAAANAYLNSGAPDSLVGWGQLGRQLVTGDKRPRGGDLTLTLNADLQLAAFELLRDRRGAALLLRPDDGAVLVMASAPSYDPNGLSAALFRDHDPAAPLLNRATQGLYPPGSTFKIATAALALDQGFQGTLFCPADGFTTSSHNKKIRDHAYYIARREGRQWQGYGDLDLPSAFAQSSNVFFAQLGVQYGHDAFYHNAKRLYFDKTILLHENQGARWVMRTGRLPHIKTSDRYGLAQMSIGQGKILTTPAHMALIAAAVANGGLAMNPRLAASDPPRPLARLMSASTARQLAAMMRQVVSEGTARGIDNPAFTIAGKTGTAQNSHGEPHSWFIGFAPVQRPALAVCVIVENGGYGSRTAAPMARDLLLEAQRLGLLR